SRAVRTRQRAVRRRFGGVHACLLSAHELSGHFVSPQAWFRAATTAFRKAYWFDERGKRHSYVAGRYIDSAMSYCEAARKNQSLFPTKYGATFSADFDGHCRRVLRLLWHCCGHLYSKHWDLLAVLNLRP
ncbi:Mob1/phocein family protein, partial [Aphelenchoides avenae]